MDLNAGCGTHSQGWVNTDLKETETTHPDILVTLDDPFPFPDASADRVYMGHVLEHVVWAEIPGFLAEVRRVLKPGAPIVATGPDAYRTCEEWIHGRATWDLLQGVLEAAPLPGSTDWPNAHHQWNMHEQRVIDILDQAGFVDLVPTRTPPHGWPVTNWSDWQCCVAGRNPA